MAEEVTKEILQKGYGKICSRLGCKKHTDEPLAVPALFQSKRGKWEKPILKNNESWATCMQACTSTDAMFLPSTDSDRAKEFDGNACRFFWASHRDVGWSLPKTEYKGSATHGWDSDWLESNREKLDDTSDSFFARFLAAWQDDGSYHPLMLGLLSPEITAIAKFAVSRGRGKTPEKTSVDASAHATAVISKRMQNQTMFEKHIKSQANYKACTGARQFATFPTVIDDLVQQITSFADEMKIVNDHKMLLTTFRTCLKGQASTDYQNLSSHHSTMEALAEAMKKLYAGKHAVMLNLGQLAGFFRDPQSAQPSLFKSIDGKLCFHVGDFLSKVGVLKTSADANNPEPEESAKLQGSFILAQVYDTIGAINSTVVQEVRRHDLLLNDGKFTAKSRIDAFQKLRAAAGTHQFSRKGANAGWVEVTDSETLATLAATSGPTCQHCLHQFPDHTSRHANHVLKDCSDYKKRMARKTGDADRPYGSRGRGKGRGRGNYQGGRGRGGNKKTPPPPKRKQPWNDKSKAKKERVEAFAASVGGDEE